MTQFIKKLADYKVRDYQQIGEFAKFAGGLLTQDWKEIEQIACTSQLDQQKSGYFLQMTELETSWDVLIYPMKSLDGQHVIHGAVKRLHVSPFKVEVLGVVNFANGKRHGMAYNITHETETLRQYKNGQRHGNAIKIKNDKAMLTHYNSGNKLFKELLVVEN